MKKLFPTLLLPLLLLLALLPSLALGQATDVRIKKRAAVVVSTAVSVGTTATALPTTVATNRISVCVTNMSTSSVVYIGPSGVTTSTGTALAPASGSIPGGSYCDDTNAPIYGIVASGTADVRVLEN